jgi:hypothetical protein
MVESNQQSQKQQQEDLNEQSIGNIFPKDRQGHVMLMQHPIVDFEEVPPLMTSRVNRINKPEHFHHQ